MGRFVAGKCGIGGCTAGRCGENCFFVRCNKLEIKINYLVGDYMLVCRAAGFIYRY